MEETLRLLDERIKILEDGLTLLTPGSEEYDRMERSLAELIKIRAQVAKDDSSNETDIRERKKDRWVRIGIAGAEITIPLLVYSILWKQGLAFEKDGYISSSSVKNLVQRFKFF